MIRKLYYSESIMGNFEIQYIVRNIQYDMIFATCYWYVTVETTYLVILRLSRKLGEP